MNDDVSKPMAAVAEYVELVIALNCGYAVPTLPRGRV